MKTLRALTLATALTLPLACAHAQSADPLAPLRGLVTQGAVAADQAATRVTRALSPRHHVAHVAHHAPVRHAAHRLVVRKVAVPARFKVAKAAPRVDQMKVAERAGFKKVSDLTNGAFPPFYPSLGVVLVKPDTLPVGPYRCFDRGGRLVSTVYMLPLADLDSHHTWDKVAGLPAPVDHATAYFHPGHPGVQVPHYHMVLWHVADESSVAK